MEELLQLVREEERIESISFEVDLNTWIVCVRDGGSFNCLPEEIEHALENLDEYL